LNLEGNNKNININGAMNVFPVKSGNPVVKTFPNGLYFQNDLFAKAPKKSVVTQNVTVPFNNQYSPKQLLNAYNNENYLNFLINSNPELKKFLSENGIDGKVYTNHVSSMVNTHLTSTSAIALQLANKMNISASDKKILEQACVFHDFGKVLIPPEIVNKPSGLTSEEKRIMDLHAELGYQLLSNTGMNQKTLNLIRNHHKPQELNNDVLGQILSVADIYSALREQRSYKTALSDADTLKILDQKAKNGEVSAEVVNTLKSIVNCAKVA